MVSSQIPSMTKTLGHKSFKRHLLLPIASLEVVPSEHEEFDFSDVFGPASIEGKNDVAAENSSHSFGEVYDNPVVVHCRSHSLVGPTNRVSTSLQLSKLTLHESESSLDIIEFGSGDSGGEKDEQFICVIDEHDTESEEAKGVGLDNFEVMKLVGRGAFGKVFQVKKKGTSEIFAMKVMRKDKIMEKNHADYMKAERDILTKVDHPFIVKLRYSFQTKYRLYLVLDFVNGGHLFFQLYRQGLFREDLARVYTAEVVSAVSHLHANGVMHRDLKPENILLDSDGHAMLTDFGLAKQFKENTRSNSMCGTLEYMAPEIVRGKSHDKAADWWSVGILLFEMLTGKILQKEASKRIGSGSGGSDEIKNHKWFKPINWRKLDARQVEPSFRPNVSGANCVANFDECWTRKPLLDSPVCSPVAGDRTFTGFTYVRPATFLQNLSPLG